MKTSAVILWLLLLASIVTAADPAFFGHTSEEVSNVQDRVVGNCTGGGFITTVYENGSVECTSSVDTNATTECSAGEYLDGSGACVNLNNTIDNRDTNTDTNASTECSAGEYLDGDGTCKVALAAGNIQNVTGNFTVFNNSGNKVLHVDSSNGRTQFWDLDEGSGDYVEIYHDGTNGYVKSNSGSLYLWGVNGLTRITGNFVPDGVNTRDLGATTGEFNGLYLGEDSGSGAYFGLDQDWRLYYNETNADELQLVNGSGDLVMSFAADGDVGIGTTNNLSDFLVSSPSHTQIGIQTTSTSAAYPSIGFYNASGAKYAQLITVAGSGSMLFDYSGSAGGSFRIRNESDTGTEVFRIDSGGQVGIGTSFPSHKLNVIGTANITTGMYFGSSGSYISEVMKIGDGAVGAPAYSFTADTDTGMYRAGSNLLGFSTGGTLRGGFASTGGFFVGSTASGAAGDVYASDGTRTFNWDASASSVTIGADSASTTINAVGDVYVFDVDSNANGAATANMQFKVSNTEMARLTGTGFGVKSTAPTYILDVDGNASIDGSTFVVDDVNNRVGVVTTNPTEVLQAAGIIKSENTAYTNTGFIINQTSNTNAWRLMQFGGGPFSINLNSYTSGDSKFAIGTDGKVGIGTTTMTTLLDVNGNMSVDGTTFFVDDVNNMVGIGTTSPGTILDVRGDGRLQSDGNTLLDIRSDENNDGTNDAYVRYVDGASIVWSAGSDGSNSYAYTLSNGPFGTNDRLTITTGGNVGIGTTSPSHTLTVAGDLNVSGTSYLGDVTIQADNITTDSIISKDGNITFFDSTGAEIVKFAKGGDVGIGTTSPNRSLHIKDNSAWIRLEASGSSSYYTELQNNWNAANPFNIVVGGQDVLRIENSAWQTYLDGYKGSGLKVSGNTELYLNETGNVGIGTTSPSEKLEVIGGIKTKVQSSGNDGGISLNSLTSNPYIGFYASDNSHRFSINTSLTGTTSNDLLILDSTSSKNTLVIKGDGNVGIGTTSPNEKLTVIGNANITGIVYASNISSSSNMYVHSGGNIYMNASDIFLNATGSGVWMDGGSFGVNTAGVLSVLGTTDSSSTTTGALQVAGGIGIGGNGFFGGGGNFAGALAVAGAANLNGAVGLGDAVTDVLTVTGTIAGASPLVFEGSTADGFETTFAITDPGADYIITFPAATGEVSVLGQTIADAEVDDALTISGGTIDNSVIGGSTPAAITGTTVTANDQLVVNAGVDINGDTAGEITTEITAAISQSANIFNVELNAGTDKLTVSSVGATTIADLTATTANIDSGTIDSTTIGGSTPAAGSFTTVTTSGVVRVDDTTDSTSTITGSLQTDGGLGVAKAAQIGTTLNTGGMITIEGAGTGLKMYDSDGGGSTCHLITVDNVGTISATPVAC